MFTGLERIEAFSDYNYMGSGNEQMQTDFRNNASNVFFSVYQSFEHAVSGVSRRTGEHTFQQLKKQHAIMLEQELHKAAKQILEKYRDEKQVNEINQMFSQFIKDYLHRFVQKINDL